MLPRENEIKRKTIFPLLCFAFVDKYSYFFPPQPPFPQDGLGKANMGTYHHLSYMTPLLGVLDCHYLVLIN